MLYLVIDMVKVYEIASRHSHTSLVQDLILWFGMQLKKYLKLLFFALTMTILSVFSH